jgi:putative phosphoesterase
MRIGVVSDTHDRLEAVAEAVRLLQEQHVELILHCGDIESAETVRAFRPLPTHFVFGNWDKEKAKLAAAIKDIAGTFYETFGALEIGGKRIAWVHSHERHQLRQLENADFFDYVFYGHTHVREQHRTGKTLVANPGALFRANPKTCIVLDLATGEIKPIIVPVPPKVSGNGAPHPPAPAVDEGMGSVMLSILPALAIPPGVRMPGSTANTSPATPPSPDLPPPPVGPNPT